jgi:hypothetical protein
MLGDNGCDLHLLRNAEGDPVDKMQLMFLPMDQMILRQYECGSEPAVQLSKFFQSDYPTFHLILLNLRSRIAQMREPKFLMYGDVSHSNLEVLTNRSKTETVLSNAVEEREDVGRVEPMVQCVADFRKLFADDLDVRCNLAQWDEEKVSLMHVERLPPDIAISCLLHPVVGGTPF